MANKISLRMQSPVDPLTGERSDIHPITTEDEVIVHSKLNGNITLKRELEIIHNDINSKSGGLPVYIQDEFPDGKYPCIWAKKIN